MKAYIDSSILTDWMFLSSVEMGRAREAVGKEAKISYLLFRDILRGKYAGTTFATSSWAISESMQNYVRSFAMFNMLFDNLSLRYFEVVRDYPRYKIPSKGFTETRRWVLHQLNQAEKRGRLTINNFPSIPEAVHNYIYMGFDAVDAEHLAIAINRLEADKLVTKDRDFHDMKEELKMQFKIEIVFPSQMVESLMKPKTVV